MDSLGHFDWNHLPFPRDIDPPVYSDDSPARNIEMSLEAFNEGAVRATFGDVAMEWLLRVHGDEEDAQQFRGDWWMLAALHRRIEHQWEFPSAAISFQPLDLVMMNIGIIHLEHANLGAIEMVGATLGRIRLDHANLKSAKLTKATIFATFLDHANLCDAHLNHANLSGVHLQHANLLRANLDHANLSGADLKHACLRAANFDHACLRGVTGILFDDTKVQRLDIEGNAPDPWSTLRRTYTGPMFFVHLLLLIAFLLPYAAKVLTLTTTARGYDALRTSLEAGEGVPPGGEVVRAWLDNFDATHTQTHAVWVLLGWTHDWWWIMVPTAIAIIFYNGLRGYLTWKIGILRDQADRVDRTPTLVEYHGHCHPLAGDDAGPKRLWSVVKREWRKNKTNPLTVIGPWYLHRFARVLFCIAALSFALHALAWVFTTRVPVPN